MYEFTVLIENDICEVDFSLHHKLYERPINTNLSLMKTCIGNFKGIERIVSNIIRFPLKFFLY